MRVPKAVEKGIEILIGKLERQLFLVASKYEHKSNTPENRAALEYELTNFLNAYVPSYLFNRVRARVSGEEATILITWELDGNKLFRG